MDWDKYIKVLTWPESIRESLEFSDADEIRLDPTDQRFKLVWDYQWLRYSTDADLFVKTPAINPLAHKKWLGVQPVVDQPDDTTIQYKLHDGTTEYYWDGGAWSSAGLSDWNTITEINNNIQTFQGQAGSEHKIGFVINLKTDDEKATPTVFALKLLFEFHMELQESWLVKAFTAALDEISAQGDFEYDTEAITSSIDLNDFDMGNLNITDVAGVFDLTDDPNMFTDLLSSYNPSTKIIALATPVPSGNTVKVIVVYRPIVAITTQQDYTQLAQLPAVLIEDVKMTERLRSFAGEDFVAPGADVGWRMDAPDNMTFTMKLLAVTDLLVDQQRLAQKVLAYIKATRQLHWPDVDEYLDLVVVSPYVSGYRMNLNDVWSGALELEIRNVPYYLAPTEELPIIQTVNLDLIRTSLEGR